MGWNFKNGEKFLIFFKRLLRLIKFLINLTKIKINLYRYKSIYIDKLVTLLSSTRLRFDHRQCHFTPFTITVKIVLIFLCWSSFWGQGHNIIFEKLCKSLGLSVQYFYFKFQKLRTSAWPSPVSHTPVTITVKPFSFFYAGVHFEVKVTIFEKIYLKKNYLSAFYWNKYRSDLRKKRNISHNFGFEFYWIQ